MSFQIFSGISLYVRIPVAYPRGGMGGPDPTTFQKGGPQDSHKNVIKLVGGGSDRSVKKWSLRSLKSKHRMVFQGFAARILLSKKCLNTAGRGILSQRRMLIFKNFPGVLPTDPLISISLVISQLEHAAGYRDPCLLPCLKKSHHNDLKSCTITCMK